jgi:hypothetical protein
LEPPWEFELGKLLERLLVLVRETRLGQSSAYLPGKLWVVLSGLSPVTMLAVESAIARETR